MRIITGTLLYAGIGRLDSEELPGIVLSRDRTKAGITVPPCGLYLEEVYYEAMAMGNRQ